MSNYYLGIDIAKEKFDVCLTHNDASWAGNFENSEKGFKQLQKWLEKRKVDQLHACLEATGRYGEAVAKFLHQQGYAVSMVNPKVIHNYAQAQLQRNKTDKLDASLIARYVEREQPALWEPIPQEREVLRALTRRLSALQKSLTAENNRLQAGTHPPQVQESLDDHIAFLNAQIEKVKTQIQEHVNQHPDLKEQQELLSTIKGIGDYSAAVILGELPPLDRFEDVKQVAAYAGLTPQQLQSGKSNRQKGMSKMGSKHLRTALFMPALSAMTHNPILAALAKRLREKGKEKMTVVGAVMRKLLHLVYGVLKHQQPFDPHHLVNVQGTDGT